MGSAMLSLPRKYPYSTSTADVYCTLGCSGIVVGYVRYLIGHNVVRIVEIEVASGWRGYGWAGVMIINIVTVNILRILQIANKEESNEPRLRFMLHPGKEAERLLKLLSFLKV